MHFADSVVIVDAELNTVKLFRNSEREREQYLGARSKLPSRFDSEPEAKSYLLVVAKRLGVPGNAKLRVFRWFPNNDPRISDANRSGSIRGSFGLEPTDYPSFNCSRGYGLILDPTDGAVMQFGQSLDTTYEKPRASIEKRSALEKAVAAFKVELNRYRLATKDMEKALKPSKSDLAYTVPYRKIAMTPGPTRHLRRARLCWIVEFDRGYVAIDAEHGTVYDLSYTGRG